MIHDQDCVMAAMVHWSWSYLLFLEPFTGLLREGGVGRTREGEINVGDLCHPLKVHSGLESERERVGEWVRQGVSMIGSWK